MDSQNRIFNISSVHPLVKANFFVRSSYCCIVIIPFLSIAYEINLGTPFYIIFILQTLSWPFIAYLIAKMSRSQKSAELHFNLNMDIFIYSIWMPITSFSPLYILLLLIALGTGGLTAGGFPLLISRSVSAILGVLIGGIIFGFRYSGEITLPTIISTSIATIIISWATALFSHKTSKKMILTRKLLKDEKSKLEKELTEAADYVKTMRPSLINNGVINVNYKFIPSATLGGDAFGYHWIDSDNFAIYLLDVSGHGVGAALLSTSVLNFIRSQALSHTDFHYPSHVFEKLNLAFQADKNNDMFFTMWYGIYSKKTKILTYSSAGHPPALMFTHQNAKEQSVVKLMARNSIIGGISDNTYTQKSQHISTGTSIYIFSDGVYEIKKPDGSMLKFQEFEELLINQLEKSQKTLDNFYDYCLEINEKDRYDDDYTMIKVTFV
jgi:serine phosphatase RsbU (regulator of sigma subunit)